MPKVRKTRIGYRTSGAWLPYALKYAGQTLQNYAVGTRSKFRNAATQTMTMRKKSFRSGVGTTSNYDKKLIYRKSYMPKRRRRRWVRFIKKVDAAAERDLGLQTVLFNNSISFFNQTSGQQGECSFALYGMNSSLSRWNDVRHIAQNVNILAPTPTVGHMMDLTTKIIFKSAILDITVRNTSYFTADATQAPAMPLEVDVFEMTSGKQMTDSVNTDPDALLAAFAISATDTTNISGAGTGIQIISRGANPWDIPQALSSFKLKVLKKTKYFLPAGATFTYQMRDPKRHVGTQQYLSEYAGINKPGWTKMVMIIFKGVPGFSIGPGPSGYTEQITVGHTRKYAYVFQGENERRDRYYSL